MKKYMTLIIILVVILALAACSLFKSSQELVSPIWLLFDLQGEGPLPETYITAEFSQDGQVNGSGGCNVYHTTYTLDGDQIEFGEQVASTLMACFEPVMDQEQAYFQVLSDASTYEITDEELTLYDSNDIRLATFMALEQDLSGTSWDVIAYNNGRGGVTTLIIGTEISAEFGEDGQVTGSAGCNNYFANYWTDDNEIEIGPAAATRMLCSEPEGVMQQESEYLAALETAHSFKTEGTMLEIRNAEGAIVATFQRVLTP